jgi:hypothetical protein
MVDGSLQDWTSILQPDVGSLTSITSQGEDNRGNLYFISINGAVYMLVPEPSALGLIAAAGAVGMLLFSRDGRRRTQRSICT